MSNKAAVGNTYMKVGGTSTELTRHEHLWQRSSPRSIGHNQSPNSDARRERRDFNTSLVNSVNQQG